MYDNDDDESGGGSDDNGGQIFLPSPPAQTESLSYIVQYNVFTIQYKIVLHCRLFKCLSNMALLCQVSGASQQENARNPFLSDATTSTSHCNHNDDDDNNADVDDDDNGDDDDSGCDDDNDDDKSDC